MGKHQHATEHLARFVAYVLGRRPDEFGLVADAHGWVRIKDLLKVCCEEPGYGYVRSAHLNEILLSRPPAAFEIDGERIRATDRSRLPGRHRVETLPKRLYVCIRRRAHATVIDHGIQARGRHHVLLAATEEMARRIGTRIDAQPVTLTVVVAQALAAGVIFFSAGEALFLAPFIPTGCFTAPPLPKSRLQESSKAVAPAATAVLPGSFRMDPERIRQPATAFLPKGGKDRSWKRDRKRARREKERFFGSGNRD
jgi:putative RNA 2'-phosphotransferase